MAIETLLISDDLFRAKDVRTRQQYVDLVHSVRDNGGDVKIFSSMHVSGQRTPFSCLNLLLSYH